MRRLLADPAKFDNGTYTIYFRASDGYQVTTSHMTIICSNVAPVFIGLLTDYFLTIG